jgi:hypothetical protein
MAHNRDSDYPGTFTVRYYLSFKDQEALMHKRHGDGNAGPIVTTSAFSLAVIRPSDKTWAEQSMVLKTAIVVPIVLILCVGAPIAIYCVLHMTRGKNRSITTVGSVRKNMEGHRAGVMPQINGQ